jgi:hypothetical protein
MERNEDSRWLYVQELGPDERPVGPQGQVVGCQACQNAVDGTAYLVHLGAVQFVLCDACRAEAAAALDAPRPRRSGPRLTVPPRPLRP